MASKPVLNAVMDDKPQAPHIGSYVLSATEVAEILWLAAFVGPGGSAGAPDEPQEVGLSEEDAARDRDAPRAEGEARTPDASEPEHETAGGDDAAAAQGDAATAADIAARVYERTGVTAAAESVGGIGFKTPRAAAILEKPAIIRSLRPLQRRVPSKRSFLLDEEATAERIATAVSERGSWLPVQYPARERWLDLIVLVDGAPSMAVWAQTVDELVAMLANTGIFRDVQRWTLAVVEEEGAVNDERATRLFLQPAPGSNGLPGRQREASELIDQQQRRLFLVVSDCSAIVWDSGEAQRLLQPLARHNLVSLVQVLPEALWERTGLTYATAVRLSTRQPLTCNSQLVFEGHGTRAHGDYPYPIVSLEPEALARWARFVSGRGQHTVAGYFLPDGAEDELDVEQALADLGIVPQPAAVQPPTVDALYAAFRASVPRRAQPLAAYFAAAPLTLPVMRLVQAAMLPRSTHADFVHVYYSGLLQRRTAQTTAVDMDMVQYEFAGGDAMRRHLLGLLPRYSAEEVVELVIERLSRHIREHLDQLAAFDAVLAVRDPRALLRVDATAQYFAEVTAKVLRYLGGVYETIADNLERYVIPAPPGAADAAQAVALAQASERIWQRIAVAAAAVVEALGRLTVSSYVVAGAEAETPRPFARTEIALEGDVQAALPVTPQPDVDRALNEAHQATAAASVALRRQMLALLGPTVAARPAAAHPGPDVDLPLVVSGAGPLKMAWCWVPGGAFTMGGERYDAEKPVHQVQVDGFWLARYPVTNAQYRLFIEAGGYRQERWWTAAGWEWLRGAGVTEPRYWKDEKWNGPEQPVVGVSWYEALAFCGWATEATGEAIRLPTEAEWEKGARGVDGREFPWGSQEPDRNLCNFAGNVGGTTPVGQYSPQGDSPYGCADVAGNVWEWCLSEYHDYPYDGEDGRNAEQGTNRRVVRGGSWDDLRSSVRCADRLRYVPLSRYDDVGIRCASIPF